MSLHFITGNEKKFRELQAVLGDLERLDIDLPEIQDTDAENIIRAKLLEALNHRDDELIVEDTSLYLSCLNGLPGPLIKWFLQALGNAGLSDLAERLGDSRAEAKTIIGYARSRDEIRFFEGSVHGTIVPPDGEGFGWDPIFRPDGHERTFARMTLEEKNEISMRRIAAERLKDFLEQANPPT